MNKFEDFIGNRNKAIKLSVF